MYVCACVNIHVCVHVYIFSCVCMYLPIQKTFFNLIHFKVCDYVAISFPSCSMFPVYTTAILTPI